jgi:hypothetical protein
MAALEPHRKKVFEDARRAGRRQNPEAYLADALVSLARAGEQEGSSAPRAMVHVRVDHAALVRGQRNGDEVCEIDGIGPIPVAVARALSSDAILSAVLTEGADVKAVAIWDGTSRHGCGRPFWPETSNVPSADATTGTGSRSITSIPSPKVVRPRWTIWCGCVVLITI